MKQQATWAVLALAAAVLVLGSGCRIEGGTTAPWPTYGAEAGRTGASAASGPSPPLVEAVTIPTGVAAYAAPAVAEEAVLYLPTGTKVIAANADDGTLLWEKDLNATLEGTPSLAEDLLVLGLGGGSGTEGRAIVALDRTSGDERWRTPTEHPVESPPLIHDGVVVFEETQPLLVEGAATRIRAVALDDGSPLWEAPFPEGRFQPPALAGDVVVVGGMGAAAAFDATTGEMLWRRDSAGINHLGPTVAGDTVWLAGKQGLVGPGLLTAVESRTGRELWSLDLPVAPQSAPTRAGDLLWFCTTRSTLMGVRVSDGSLRHEVGLDAPCESKPALSLDGRLYLAVLDGLVVADGRTGRIVWRSEVPGARADVALAPGRVLVPRGTRGLSVFVEKNLEKELP